MEKLTITSPVLLMLKGRGLLTAEMTYGMPDYPNVLNTFVWQDFDVAPDYPRLFGFIEWWQDSIEGTLRCVRFMFRQQISAGEWRHVVSDELILPPPKSLM